MRFFESMQMQQTAVGQSGNRISPRKGGFRKADDEEDEEDEDEDEDEEDEEDEDEDLFKASYA